MLFNEVLGSFHYLEGGPIYLDIDKNIRYGSEMSTYIHEIHHKHLMNCTSLGFVIHVLDLERMQSEGADPRHSGRYGG